jgi:antitoxin component YwqK of YwqJK toxin-antitoxin module
MKNRTLYFILLIFLGFPALAQPLPGENKTDSLGQKQGYWRKYVNDTLKYEGTFKDNVPMGEFKYYYGDKKIKSTVQYSDKGLKAVTVDYQSNGKKMAEGDYWDKKKHGLWKYYNTEGVLIKQEDYHNGVPEGVWMAYYADGKPNEIKHYTSGKKNGDWLRFYPDSLLWLKGAYVNDKLNGLFSYYDLEGKIGLSGNYKDDLKIGPWFYYDKNGMNDRRVTYKAGLVQKEEITTRENDKTNTWVDLDSIAYIFSNNGKATIRMKDGKDHVSMRKIDDFDRILPDFQFCRVNFGFYVTHWSITNSKLFSSTDKILILRPAAPATVIVADTYLEGFMTWADLHKGEIKIDKPPSEQGPQGPGNE